jgi:hypothetical protein
MVDVVVASISVVVHLALREITVKLDGVYLQGVHAQNPASMEHAGLTIHVCVMQAGMEGCVIKVSDQKLTVMVCG